MAGNTGSVGKAELDSKTNSVVDFDDTEDGKDPLTWKASLKWFHIALLSWMGFVMTLGDLCFAPSLSLVLAEFETSSASPLSAFVISVYSLGSLAGNLFGPQLSEVYGRLPVLHVSNSLFIIFAVASALSPSMSTLVAFRFLDGTAASVLYTLGPSIIGDMFVQEKRGGAISIYSLGQLVGPTVGPVIGGFLAEKKGWRWVFWFIAILSGADFIPAVLIMRESYSPFILSRKAKRLRSETGNTELRSKYDTDGILISQRQKLAQAIIRPVKMFFFLPMVTIIAFYLALGYGYVWIIFTRLNIVYQTVYNFSQGAVGLTYLGVGIGTILGAIGIGVFSDRYMIWVAGDGEKKPEYRLPPMVLGAIFVPGGLMVYGWAAEFKLQWAIPLVGTGMMGFGLLISLLTAQTYLVDSSPLYSASAIAVIEILLALSGSLFPLAGPPLYNHLGLGWGNSLLSFIALPFVPLPWILLKYGERIRKSKYSQIQR